MRVHFEGAGWQPIDICTGQPDPFAKIDEQTEAMLRAEQRARATQQAASLCAAAPEDYQVYGLD